MDYTIKILLQSQDLVREIRDEGDKRKMALNRLDKRLTYLVNDIYNRMVKEREELHPFDKAFLNAWERHKDEWLAELMEESNKAIKQ